MAQRAHARSDADAVSGDLRIVEPLSAQASGAHALLSKALGHCEKRYAGRVPDDAVLLLERLLELVPEHRRDDFERGMLELLRAWAEHRVDDETVRRITRNAVAYFNAAAPPTRH